MVNFTCYLFQLPISSICVIRWYTHYTSPILAPFDERQHCYDVWFSFEINRNETNDPFSQS